MKTLVSSLLILCFSLSLQAEKLDPLKKVVNISAAASADARLELDAHNTDVEITVWDKNELAVEVEVEYRGTKHRDKVQEFMDNLESEVKSRIKSSPNTISIETYRSTPHQIKIGWDEFYILGITVSQDDFRLLYRIKMPAFKASNIKHSYQDLRIKGELNQVDLEQYSGRFSAETLTDCRLTMKYGNAHIIRIENGKVQLYENKLSGNRYGKLDLNAKYSEVMIEDLESLELVAYETNLGLRKVDRMEANMKYSKMKSEDVDLLELEAYECTFEISKLKVLEISNSKYSKYQLGEVRDIEIGIGYEDDMKINEVQRFNAGNSKYCKHDIQNLERNYKLQGYETKLRIAKLAGETGDITIQGKYIKAQINTADAVFELQGALQYGEFDYPESRIDGKVMKNDNNILLNLKSKGENDGNGYNFLINGYEMNVQLL